MKLLELVMSGKNQKMVKNHKMQLYFITVQNRKLMLLERNHFIKKKLIHIKIENRKEQIKNIHKMQLNVEKYNYLKFNIFQQI